MPDLTEEQLRRLERRYDPGNYVVITDPEGNPLPGHWGGDPIVLALIAEVRFLRRQLTPAEWSIVKTQRELADAAIAFFTSSATPEMARTWRAFEAAVDAYRAAKEAAGG